MVKYNLPIGLSTCGGKPLTPENLTDMRECGIEGIELSFPNFDGFDFVTARRNTDAAGIRIWSMHLPFYPFDRIDISSTNRELRGRTIEFLSELMKKASTEAGVDRFIIHPSGEPIPDEVREGKMQCAMDSLGVLAERAHGLGAVIAVEELPRTCLGRDSSELERLLSVNDKLRVCFDTNHLLREPISDFIRNVGGRIITLHVSDYDWIDERHWLPGEGKTDWQALIAALEAVGYDGPWLYEVGYEPEWTISRRTLTNHDFAENAGTIFRGETPAPIGMPNV